MDRDTCHNCEESKGAPAFCPHCGAEINRMIGPIQDGGHGDYYVDVGNDAQSFFSHRLDRQSDVAAKRALRRFLRNNVWPTPVVGRLYRWDAEANAPAAKPLLRVERDARGSERP